MTETWQNILLNVYFDPVVHIPSSTVEGAGYMTCILASHQGARNINMQTTTEVLDQFFAGVE